MVARHLFGSVANRQQGTQEAPLAKRRPAAAYGRDSSRAAPTGNTPMNESEDRADKDARDRKHGTGKYSKQKLFP